MPNKKYPNFTFSFESQVQSPNYKNMKMAHKKFNNSKIKTLHGPHTFCISNE